MNFAAGRLTTPLAELRAQYYAPVLDNIQAAMSEQGTAPASANKVAQGGSIVTEELKDSVITINNNFGSSKHQ
jgi:hypothetical protein